MGDKYLLVIVVTYNALKWADKCFESLKSSSVKCDVLAVDNGSTDGCVDYIRKKFPEVSIIETGENLGFGRANNIGMKKALDEGYKYVYLLNEDAWVFPDTFKELIQIHSDNPSFGILSPMQMQANMKHFDSNFAQYVICENERNSSVVSDMFLNCLKSVYEVSYAPAAHWLVSVDCVAKVGGFSPSFPHYGEDNNYCQRAAFHGYNIGIVPGVKVVHDRENRIATRAHENYMMYYIVRLIEMNDPFKNVVFNTFAELLKSLRQAFRDRNLDKFRYTRMLSAQKKIILSNRKKSMVENCPFL